MTGVVYPIINSRYVKPMFYLVVTGVLLLYL